MTERHAWRSEVNIGQAMITMVEPVRDGDRFAEYNRWYEFDHAYSALMVGPGAFSFRRWVATKELKDLRYPRPSTVAVPVEAGSFIATYYFASGMLQQFYDWQSSAMPALMETGRMNTDRTHVNTSLYDFTGSMNRLGWPVGPHLSLDHPYAGLVAMWCDRARAAALEDLDAWLRTTLHPSILTPDGPVAQALTFRPRDAPGAAGSGVGVGERVLALFFLQCDPRDAWSRHFSNLNEAVAASKLGTVGLVAAFLPVVPGTTLHHDELWCDEQLALPLKRLDPSDPT